MLTLIWNYNKSRNICFVFLYRVIMY